jgi:hypothetical protein
MGRPRRSTSIGGKAPDSVAEVERYAESSTNPAEPELPGCGQAAVLPDAAVVSIHRLEKRAPLSAAPPDFMVSITGKQPPTTPRVRLRSATEAQLPGPLTARWDAMASVGATRSLCTGKLQRVLYSVALENARVAGTSAAQRGIARRQLMRVRPLLHAP